jgi:hypothetical protein
LTETAFHTALLVEDSLATNTAATRWNAELLLPAGGMNPVFVPYGQANLRVLDVKEIKTVPYVPLSHPFVERLIGTIRREYLDETLFWTAADLEKKLRTFQHYFNRQVLHALQYEG